MYTKYINQSVELITNIKEYQVYRLIEVIGRTAYKSEDRITPNSAERFVRMLKNKGHLSVFEHYSIAFRIVTNRAIANELVRHRIASYTQESTRYVNYAKREVRLIKDDNHTVLMMIANDKSIEAYLDAVENGIKPEIARDVLPLSLATEIVATMNIRSWLHFLELRTHKTAHPQMRELANKIKNILTDKLPVIFKEEV
jgi:thymidylate synthase (FAD)